MSKTKGKLLLISNKLLKDMPIKPSEINMLLNFSRKSDEGKNISFIKNIALPLSLVLGFFYAAFPYAFNSISQDLPKWTNLSPEILAGVDYFWDILGEPVGKANIIFHLPNVVLYSFGVFGIKQLIESIDRKTWIDKVINAKIFLQEKIEQGILIYDLHKGHSILFVGSGDFIGMQHVLNHKPEEAITISELKPEYTQIWNFYNSKTMYEDLKNILIRCDGKNAGEYIFFPVKDDQIFLPNDTAYDLSPHRLDILCQNIRTIEKEMGWNNKRIIIIGDKFHKSYVQSEDKKHVIPGSSDTISLLTLAKKYNNTTVLDPSDIVIKAIIKIANGRKIVFRATKDGLKEYKNRFYTRLKKLGYKQKRTKKGILTIGYDLFEDQTEQQTLARVIDDYYPVVLSKNVRDALIRNGYKESEFLYVPQLVLNILTQEASKQ